MKYAIRWWISGAMELLRHCNRKLYHRKSHKSRKTDKNCIGNSNKTRNIPAWHSCRLRVHYAKLTNHKSPIRMENSSNVFNNQLRIFGYFHFSFSFLYKANYYFMCIATPTTMIERKTFIWRKGKSSFPWT